MGKMEVNVKQCLVVNPINGLSKNHMNTYQGQKDAERLTLSVMEECAELMQVTSKLRRKVKAGEDCPQSLFDNLAEEAAHVYMSVQNICHLYNIGSDKINQQIEMALKRFYDGRENP